jgi:hypothetical protein
VAFGYASACVALVGAMRIGGGLRELFRWNWSNWQSASAAQNDLRGILRRYRDYNVQMGYGETADYASFYRPEIVFATNRLVVDAQALSDMDLDGIELPPATIDAIVGCANDVWLIPRGEEPFLLPNAFSAFSAIYPEVVPPRRLFGAAVADGFVQHHQKKESVGPFDVWTCNDDGLSTVAPTHARPR